MNRSKFIYGTLLAAFAYLVIGSQDASAQQSAPTSNHGLEALTLETVDLGMEIEGMQDRQLRLRMLTLEPGGHIGVHSHKDRPAVAYILQGTTTVTFGNGTVRRFSAGESISATKDTTHWHRNEEQENMTLVTVDVRKLAE